MRKAFLLIAVFVLSNCGTVKKTHLKEINKREKHIDSLKLALLKEKRDSTIHFKDRIIYRPTEKIVEVSIECDSMGRIKPIKTSLNNGNSSTFLQIEANKLLLRVKSDSLVSHWEYFYREKFERDSIELRHKIKSEFESTLNTEETVVKRKWPWWLYALMGLTIASIVATFLPTFWNIFRNRNS